MRNRLSNWWVVLLVLSFVWSAPAPALAARPAQDGQQMEDFAKPEWGMTMQYPFDWTVEDRGDLVTFTAEDYSAFTVIRDDAYLDMKQSLTRVTQSVLNKLGVNNMGLRVAPQQGSSQRREAVVSGVEATYYVGWVGYVIQFVANDAGYVIFCSAVADAFGGRQALFSAMAESVKFEGQEQETPTRAPTPRKKPPTATPKPSPASAGTRTPRPGPAPTATPPPKAISEGRTAPVPGGGPVTAREAYDAAWPLAEEWSTEAVLDWAQCEAPAAWSGERLGRCSRWELQFLKNPTAAEITMTTEGEPNAYDIIVTNGHFDPKESKKYIVWKKGPMISHTGSAGPDWVNSDAAAQAFLDAGGAEFTTTHAGEMASRLEVARLSPDDPAVWIVSAEHEIVPGEDSTFPYEKLELRVYVDAAEGVVDTEARPPAAQGQTLTLREAADLALPEAQAWRADAQLTQATASARADDAGADEGKAGRWTLTYMVKSARDPNGVPDFYCVDVVDGRVEPNTELSAHRVVALPAQWPDSGEAWARLKATADYPLIAQRFPQAGRFLELYADWGGRYVWTAKLETGGVRLSLEIMPPKPTSTPEPGE